MTIEYNMFRWYRAGWGRYTQADPIGLRGGANLFGYVLANPIRTTDRLGLVAWRCDFEVLGIGEIVGGAAFRADCVSPCINGIKRNVSLTAAVGGITFGVPIIHTITKDVLMEDGASEAHSANLVGKVEYHGLGANLIVGCGQADFVLGKAKGSTGFSCSWWAGVIAGGLDNFWGHAEVSFEKKECCK